jgi:CubicO group peptidase (beta-lactamase class C family)
LTHGLKEGVYPGAVLVYGRPLAGVSECLCIGTRGITRDVYPVHDNLIYDLASLTKILATTFLIMIEVTRGRLRLDRKLGELGWSGPVAKKSLAAVLAHQSGLAPWRPFYSLRPEPSMREAYRRALTEEPLEPGLRRTVYSDLNFMILGFVLEELNQCSLEELFRTEIAGPLCLPNTGFNLKEGTLAPTEDGPRIGGPLDYKGAKIMGPVPLGRVHDDNAAFLGGAGGQAGLFGTAPEIWRLLSHWAGVLNGQAGLVSKEVLTAFISPQKARKGPVRALGFDLGTGFWTGTVGHVGYTGGCVFWDPLKDEAVVFLCNRVHPTARNRKILDFRPKMATVLRS